MESELSDLIINCEIYDHMVFASLVKRLGLKIEQYPEPYNSDWIHRVEGKPQITISKPLVIFNDFVNNIDEALRHVISTTVYHLLLRRAWKPHYENYFLGTNSTYLCQKPSYSYIELATRGYPSKGREYGNHDT